MSVGLFYLSRLGVGAFFNPPSLSMILLSRGKMIYIHVPTFQGLLIYKIVNYFEWFRFLGGLNQGTKRSQEKITFTQL